ncbi:hypothetical protein HPB47_024316, partial [Ixodes persulcatus]
AFASAARDAEACPARGSDAKGSGKVASPAVSDTSALERGQKTDDDSRPDRFRGRPVGEAGEAPPPPSPDCLTSRAHPDRVTLSVHRCSEHLERNLGLQHPGILGSIPAPARFDLNEHRTGVRSCVYIPILPDTR